MKQSNRTQIPQWILKAKMVFNEPAVQGAYKEKIASMPYRLGLKQNKTTKKQIQNRTKQNQKKKKNPTKQVPTNNQ